MKKKSSLYAALLALIVVMLFSQNALAASRKVKSVKLSKTKVTMTVGQSKTLKVTIKPSGASKNVVWKSSNKKVVTVSSKGILKAKKAGTAKITCSSKKYPKIKATCEVTVKKPKVSGISLSDTTLTLTEEETYTLKATVTPSNADDKKVEWKSSDTNVVTVSSKGRIKAVKAGTATVTCKSVKYPGISTSCKITVEKKRNEDLELLEEAKYIMAKTGKPLYQRRNNIKSSYETDSSGQTIWSVGTSANGVVKTIKVYKNGSLVGETDCNGWGSPDNTKTPFGKITWGNWKNDTTKAEFEELIGHSVSTEVFDLVKAVNSNTYYFSASGGGATVILYGQNDKGELIGKFAGVTCYNWDGSNIYLRVKGIDPDNKESYGENYFELVAW